MTRHPGNLAGKGPVGLKEPKAKPDPAYLARVRGLPCCICEAWGFPQIGPTYAHHTICGRGSQEKTPDHQAIPLCWPHHQGPDGIHESRAEWVEQFGPDTDYIAPTQDRLREVK